MFLHSVLTGTQPEISGEEALSSMRAIFASIESSKTGMTVEIPENR